MAGFDLLALGCKRSGSAESVSVATAVRWRFARNLIELVAMIQRLPYEFFLLAMRWLQVRGIKSLSLV
jgi:hypothetical protein